MKWPASRHGGQAESRPYECVTLNRSDFHFDDVVNFHHFFLQEGFAIADADRFAVVAGGVIYFFFLAGHWGGKILVFLCGGPFRVCVWGGGGFLGRLGLGVWCAT